MPALHLLLRGLLLGFSVAAPVGVIGILVIRRTIASGRLAGLVSGLGAATADAVYGCIAGFGLTFVSSKLIASSYWIRLAGGVFLVFLGIRALRAPAAPLSSDGPPESARRRGLARAFGSVLLLTLSNPVTLLAFLGIMAGAGVGDTPDSYGLAAALIAGVFLGSMLWWITLSTAVSFFRPWILRPRAMVWVNRLSAAVIAGFGVFTIGQLILRGR